MLEALKKQWKVLRADPPGSRFRLRYERRNRGRRSPVAKVAWLVAGVLIVAAGLVLMPAPGPGMIVVALGAAILAQESLYVATSLDALETAVRGWKRPGKRGAVKRARGAGRG